MSVYTIRNVLYSVLLVCLVVVATGYVAINVPHIQQKIVNYVLHLLEEKTNAKVEIKSAQLELFNRIILKDITIQGRDNDTIFVASRLAANVNVFALIRQQLIINTVQLYNFDLRLSKSSPEEPLNVQFIIDALTNKEATPIELDNIEVGALILRKGKVTYDVYSELPLKGTFDPNHISVDKIQLDVSLNMLTSDTLVAEVKKLSLREKSGFEIKHLSLAVNADKEKAQIKQFRLLLPNSKLLFYNILADYKDLMNTTASNGVGRLNQHAKPFSFNVELAPSKLYLPDIESFVPMTKKLPYYAQAQMSVRGTSDSIVIQDFSVLIQNGLELVANGEILHPNNKQELRVDVDISKMNGNAKFVYNLLSAIFPDNKKALYPVLALGSIRSSCNVKGGMPKLVASGELKSNIGDLRFLANMQSDSMTDIMKFSLNLNSSPINVQQLIATLPLTQLETKIAVDCSIKKNKLLAGSFDATFDKIEYSGFSYNGLHLKGEYGKGTLKSEVEMTNGNGNIRIASAVSGLDIGKQIGLVLSFKGDNINISPFLNKGVEPMIVSADGEINLLGTPDELPIGSALLSNLSLDWGGRVWKMDHFNYTSEKVENEDRIRIVSPLIKGYMNGNVSRYTIANNIKEVISGYLSVLFPFENVVVPNLKLSNRLRLKSLIDNKFDFSFVINNTESLCETLKIPYSIIEPTGIRGSFAGEEKLIELNLFAPLIKLPTLYIEDVAMDITNLYGDGLLCSLSAQVPTGKDTWTLGVEASALNNVVSTSLKWSNKGALLFAGKIDCKSLLINDLSGKLAISTEFIPTNFHIGDSLWQFQKATILANTSLLDIKGFGFSKHDQSLTINGSVSALPSDSLRLRLNNIDIDYIFSILNLKSVTFGGIAGGDVTVSSLMDNPRVNIDGLRVKKFSLNHVELGDLSVNSWWDHQRQGIVLDGVVQNNKDKTVVHGLIQPMADSLSIDIDSKNLNSSFLNFWLGNILNNISGNVSGKIRIYGKSEDITLSGAIHSEGLNFSIPFINSNYTLTDTIRFTPNSINFTNAKIKDKWGNNGSISGGLTHDYLRDIKFNIHLLVDQMNVFDVPHKKENPYYGAIFATGMADIYGDEKLVNIDVKARSTQGSKFTFILPDVKTADDYSFIRFTSPQRKTLIEHIIDTASVAVKTETPIRRKKRAQETEAETVMNVNILMDVNQDAALSMVLDQATGDVIQCSGGGNITLNYNSVDDEMLLFGTYTIERGSYGFSFQNIFNRDFAISSGSTVSISGDPMTAVMNINAVYNMTANLLDLNRSFSDVNRTTVPVQCLLNINGTVDHPTLGFDLFLPNNTDDVNRRIKNVIGSEDMMNRQIIYLMLLGRFYTVDYTNMSGTNSGELTSAVLSSTVSALFGSILSELSPNWKIGANYRVNSLGNFQDAEVALSSQLLNNRLLFNGNFGYREDLQSQSSFIGDFDLEYILNDAGTLSVKAYNKTNEKNYYIKNSLTTQGIGIVYKKNFTTVKELFRESLYDSQTSGRMKKDSIKVRKDSIKAKKKAERIRRSAE